MGVTACLGHPLKEDSFFSQKALCAFTQLLAISNQSSRITTATFYIEYMDYTTTNIKYLACLKESSFRGFASTVTVTLNSDGHG